MPPQAEAEGGLEEALTAPYMRQAAQHVAVRAGKWFERRALRLAVQAPTAIDGAAVQQAQELGLRRARQVEQVRAQRAWRRAQGGGRECGCVRSARRLSVQGRGSAGGSGPRPADVCAALAGFLKRRASSTAPPPPTISSHMHTCTQASKQAATRRGADRHARLQFPVLGAGGSDVREGGPPGSPQQPPTQQGPGSSGGSGLTGHAPGPGTPPADHAGQLVLQASGARGDRETAARPVAGAARVRRPVPKPGPALSLCSLAPRCAGGQALFLGPFNLRMLEQDCQRSGRALPARLEARVLELEALTQTEATRRQFKASAAVPIGGARCRTWPVFVRG